MTFVEDSATQIWGERSICSPAYFFNGLLASLLLLCPPQVQTHRAVALGGENRRGATQGGVFQGDLQLTADASGRSQQPRGLRM